MAAYVTKADANHNDSSLSPKVWKQDDFKKLYFFVRNASNYFIILDLLKNFSKTGKYTTKR